MDQSLRRKLDRITDVLWAGGVTNPVTYIEQISYLIYLKLLDEEEAARELRDRLGAGRQRGASLSLAGRALPLVQVALQERRRATRLRPRRGVRLHGLAREGRATGRRVLSRRGPGNHRSQRAQTGDRRAGLDRVPQARPRRQGRRLRISPDPPRPVRAERAIPHPTPDPRLHGRDGGPGPRRHPLRSRLRHRGLPHRRRGPHPRPLQRDPGRSADLRRGTGWRSAARPSKRSGRRSRPSRPTGRVSGRRSQTGAGSKPPSTAPTCRAR